MINKKNNSTNLTAELKVKLQETIKEEKIKQQEQQRQEKIHQNDEWMWELDYDKNGKLVISSGHRREKRIYTIDEANAVAGEKNRVSITYR